MRGVPWWGVVSAFLSPVLLVSGWTVAADLQPQYDPVRDTVSLLAAVGAADRWVMSLTFVVVGLCDVITALALRPARRAGRVLLVAGSVAGMLIAASPENLRGGFGSVPHFVLGVLGFALLTFWPLAAARRGPGQPCALRPGPAAVLVAGQVALLAWFGSVPHFVLGVLGFALLTFWPLAAARRGPGQPWALRPGPAAVLVAGQVALLAWFGAELITAAGQAGLAERIIGTVQALWPLAVVLSARMVAPAPALADANQTRTA